MPTTNFSITLHNTTLKKLDKVRDLIPRSAFINKVIEEYFKNN